MEGKPSLTVLPLSTFPLVTPTSTYIHTWDTGVGGALLSTGASRADNTHFPFTAGVLIAGLLDWVCVGWGGRGCMGIESEAKKQTVAS